MLSVPRLYKLKVNAVIHTPVQIDVNVIAESEKDAIAIVRKKYKHKQITRFDFDKKVTAHFSSSLQAWPHTYQDIQVPKINLITAHKNYAQIDAANLSDVMQTIINHLIKGGHLWVSYISGLGYSIGGTLFYKSKKYTVGTTTLRALINRGLLEVVPRNEEEIKAQKALHTLPPEQVDAFELKIKNSEKTIPKLYASPYWRHHRT